MAKLKMSMEIAINGFVELNDSEAQRCRDLLAQGEDESSLFLEDTFRAELADILGVHFSGVDIKKTKVEFIGDKPPIVCTDCKGSLYMQAFCESRCEYCGKEIISSHTPGRALCDSCSNRLGLCVQCGRKEDR